MRLRPSAVVVHPTFMGSSLSSNGLRRTYTHDDRQTQKPASTPLRRPTRENNEDVPLVEKEENRRGRGTLRDEFERWRHATQHDNLLTDFHE